MTENAKRVAAKDVFLKILEWGRGDLAATSEEVIRWRDTVLEALLPNPEPAPAEAAQPNPAASEAEQPDEFGLLHNPVHQSLGVCLASSPILVGPEAAFGWIYRQATAIVAHVDSVAILLKHHDTVTVALRRLAELEKAQPSEEQVRAAWAAHGEALAAFHEIVRDQDRLDVWLLTEVSKMRAAVSTIAAALPKPTAEES